MRRTLAALLVAAALAAGSRSGAAAPIPVWHLPTTVTVSVAAGHTFSPLAPSDVAPAPPRVASPGALRLGAVTPIEHPNAPNNTQNLTASGWTVEGNASGRKLGFFTVTAGDVNNDGYSDELVTAEGFSAAGTRVQLYLGGPGGPSTTPVWSQTNYPLSPKAAPAGDVNGDGYADFMVSYAQFGSPGAGQIQVWYGSFSGVPTGPFVVTSNVAPFGWAIGTAGDVNGDGYDDVLVGNPAASCSGTGSGSFSLYYGAPGGLTAGNAVSYCVPGLPAGSDLSWSVSTAGDVNGDGYDDVIVGAPYSGGGHAYIYLGSATGLGSSFQFPPVTLTSTDPNGEFGFSVATAGDINGDGYADVIVGSPGFRIGGIADVGAAFIFGGGPSLTMPVLWQNGSCCNGDRFGTIVAAAGDLNGDGYADFAVSAPGVSVPTHPGAGFVWVTYGTGTGVFSNTAGFFGTQSNEAFGGGLGTAGDPDGDGFSDLIIGGEGWTNPENTEGHAVIYRGGADRPQLASMWSTFGSQPAQNVGWSVAAAGDVNGDGYADVIVGCPGYDQNEENPDLGFAYLFHGGANGLEAGYSWISFGDTPGGGQGLSVAGVGDVNGDGYEDVLVGEPGAAKAKLFYGAAGAMSSTPAWTNTGAPGSLYGYSVAGAGDVNHDGYADILVGAPTDDAGGTDAGRAYLYLGGPAGVSLAAAQIFTGTQTSEQLGEWVAGVGDLNGDAHSDIAIGSPGYDAPHKNFPPFVDAGRVAVYYGDPLNVHDSPDWVKFGAEGDRYGSRIAGPIDVNGDGFADLAVGSPYSSAALTHAGQVQVYLGSATGPASPAAWTLNGDETDGQLGWMVASAGDVNGDGASDLMVGSLFLGASDAGRASVYSGVGSTVPFWTRNGDLAGDWFGFSGGGVGDVNGDGFGDLVISAIAADIVSGDDGRVTQYLGNLQNGDDGLDRFTQLRRSIASTTPIAPLGTTDQADRVRMSAKGRTAAGSGVVGLQYRLTPTTGGGPVLSGLAGSYGHALAGSGGASSSIGGLVTGLSPNGNYALQLRVRAPHSPYFPWTPWMSPGRGGRATMGFTTQLAATDAEGGAIASGVTFAAPSPNPSQEVTALEFSIPSRGAVRLAVYDLAGREIARLAEGSFAAGTHRLEWSGADRSGHAVGAGVYFARLETGGHTTMRRLVRLN